MIELFYNERDPRYIFLMHDGATTQVRKLNRRTRKFEQKEVPEILALEEHLNQIPDYMFTPSFAGIPKPVCFLEKKRFGERIAEHLRNDVGELKQDTGDRLLIGASEEAPAEDNKSSEGE